MTVYSKLPDIMTAQIKPTYYWLFHLPFSALRKALHLPFWASATWFFDIDLLTNFTTVNLEHTLHQLSSHWTPAFWAKIYK